MTGTSQPAYIRRALVEPEPPPLPVGDAVTWARARLFDGVFNTLLTLVSGVFGASPKGTTASIRPGFTREVGAFFGSDRTQLAYIATWISEIAYTTFVEVA